MLNYAIFCHWFVLKEVQTTTTWRSLLPSARMSSPNLFNCHPFFVVGFFFFPASPRAQCLPQYGGPCSQQHSAGSGLRQAADPAAVRALLPASSPLRPQRRSTPEERHPVAGRVSRQERQQFRFFSLLGCSARGEGNQERAESVMHRFDSFTVFNALASVHTRAHSPRYRLVFMNFHSADFKFSAAPVVPCRPQIKCHLIDHVTAQWPTCCPFN